MNQNTPESDDIVGDLHKVRERLLESHGGDLKSLFEELQKKQYESGRKVVDHIESPKNKVSQNQR